MTETSTSTHSEEANPNRNLFIGLGIIAAVLVIAICVIVVIFAVLDPFNIIARLTGRYDPIANALPPDTALYMSMDFTELRTDETNRIIEAFVNAAEAAGIEETTSLREDLDESLQESLNITVTDDILPWIGQYIGLSVSSLDFGYVNEPSGDIILLIEVRNRRKADDFVEKIVANLGEEIDQDIDEVEYRGMTIYEIQSEIDYERFAFGRSENVFIVATNIEHLKDSVDATKGVSFADTHVYDEIVSALPKERAISFLINTNFFESFQDTYDELLPGFEEYQSEQLQAFRWMAGSIATIEEGVQMDFIVAYDEEFLSRDQLQMMESGYDDEGLASFYPEETLLYFAGARLDLMWENLRESNAQTNGNADFEESMELFEDEFGFNPDKDLFPLFDGDWSIGLIHTRDGYLAEEMEIPLGLIIMIETSDDEGMQDILEKIVDGIEYSGLGATWQRLSDDLIFYDFEDPYEGAIIFTFGAGKGLFMLGTDPETLDETFTRGKSLLDNDNFARAFPTGMRPVMFLNLSDLFDILEDEFRMSGDSEALSGLEIFRPMSSIAAASAPYEDGIVQTTIVVFIESE
jgi:hypothetical protein